MSESGKPAASRVREHSEYLFKQFAQTKDPELRAELVNAHQNLVHYLAAKFANRGEPLEDLISVGNIGLVNAVDRFDPNRGIKFSTFATPTIVGEIRRYFRDKAWSLKVPRRLQELNQTASRASARLLQKLGRAPTIAELAQEIQASEEDTLAALELANAYETVSIDAPQSGADGSSTTPGDTIGSEDESLGKLEAYDDLTRALESLGDRERSILYYRFFNDMSQTEVAKRLNISQMHVSRLQSKALKRLKQLLTK
ncbi:MAG: SigB/SigF/SigG family RNA polymerase sigma factor [Armatimonadetes bacterium]|nr:SigB/SigF/SigG family RNA polymerase sigma factor [Armatimonadota bacterium]